MKIILTVDRIEENIAVCMDDGECIFNIPLKSLGEICAGDIFEAEFDGEELIGAIPMPEETERKKAMLKKRLDRIVNMRSK